MDRNCNIGVAGPGPADDEPTVPLRLAPAGQPMRVVAVGGGRAAADRLKQMGLCVGRQVQLVQAGDPLIVRLYGSRVALSARLAEAVAVLPLACCGALEFEGDPAVGKARR